VHLIDPSLSMYRKVHDFAGVMGEHGKAISFIMFVNCSFEYETITFHVYRFHAIFSGLCEMCEFHGDISIMIEKRD